jgi:hypothetical protein
MKWIKKSNYHFFLFLYFVFSFIFFFPFSFHFLLISLFRFVLVDFVLLSLVSFHFVDFVSFRFVFVDFVLFRFYFVSHFIGTQYICGYESQIYLHYVYDFIGWSVRKLDFLNTIILINYNPSCMSVGYSTPHVHYPQLNSSRVCLPTNFQKFKCHIFICVNIELSFFFNFFISLGFYFFPSIFFISVYFVLF